MKLLLFADLHLDTPFRWAPAQVARRRRQALRETLQRICALARELGADALCGAGDLYEQDRFTPDTAEFLRATFAEVELPVFLAPGNHDWCGPASLYHQVRWSANVHVFTTDALTPVELTDGLTLWGAAHLAPANTDSFLDGFRVDRGGTNLALFHGSQRSDLAGQGSGKVPHAPFDAADIPRAGLAHALLGHFHTPCDGRWHTYPGNPDPLTFGEGGERGAVLLDVAPAGTVTRTRYRVAVSEVTEVTVDLTGATHSGEVRERVRATLADFTGVVRVTLVGEVAPEVDVRAEDLTELGEQLEATVVRLGALRVGYDLDALRAERTVRGQFVRDVLEAGLDEAMCQRVLVTGLRALDGRGEELEVR